jgi:dTDP-4-dehydrorhamnose reductase
MDYLELWGGLECTVNRVGDTYRDQFVEGGHDGRLSDLDRVAQLGIRTLRYPVLWEHVSPDHPDQTDWDRHDIRLGKLRQLGIRVIAGLVHHGSGPLYTNLLADDFAEGLARHSRNVAERYAWIEDWTPVNEPVTTARFSALYGHWYPHHRDERSFWLALLNQIDGTRLAMREIRRLNPRARLIQTDDLGRTYATAALRDQAAFDNARRWMGWDLLCGRVTPGHMLWQRLFDLGLGDRLRRIADDPCPPDIIGVNHYLTSDRFLDHRIDRYPEGVRGSNMTRSFVDIEGVRALHPPPPGLGGVLREAWERYGIPLAVTEVHNGCTREEQLRWTYQAWRTAHDLRADGIDLRAITVWALFGSCGWNTLLTRPGNYEPGVFDAGSGVPRPTALARLVGTLAGEGSAQLHPVLAGEGWWSRPIRLHHAVVPRPASMREHIANRLPRAVRPPPILIVGGRGTLGGALAAACRHRGLAHIVPSRPELDLADASCIAAALDAHKPWVVINAAGWVHVDDAESEPEGCLRVNRDGAELLCRLCAERGIPTVNFSSDLVFDGAATAPYTETAKPQPLNAYGRSKDAMERAIAALPGDHLVIRTAAFFSPFEPRNFAMQVVAALRDGRVQQAADDEIVSPTYVPDLCDAVLDLAIDGETGVWHLSGREAISWADFARRIAAACGLDESMIQPVSSSSLARSAPRPSFAGLASERGQMLRPLGEAITHFAQEIAGGHAFGTTASSAAETAPSRDECPPAKTETAPVPASVLDLS